MAWFGVLSTNFVEGSEDNSEKLHLG